MSGSFRFQQQQRLLNKAAFQSVFDQADFKVGNADFLILARRTADQDQARLGLIVAKKNLKTAVSRNRFKRQVRETFRLVQSDLHGLDIVVMARKGQQPATNSEQPLKSLQIKLADAWSRLSSKRHPDLAGEKLPN